MGSDCRRRERYASRTKITLCGRLQEMDLSWPGGKPPTFEDLDSWLTSLGIVRKNDRLLLAWKDHVASRPNSRRGICHSGGRDSPLVAPSAGAPRRDNEARPRDRSRSRRVCGLRSYRPRNGKCRSGLHRSVWRRREAPQRKSRICPANRNTNSQLNRCG